MSTFDELKSSFILVSKRIIKEKLTTNVEKHKEYIRDLIPAYNKIVKFIAFKERSGLLPDDQTEYKKELLKIRERFGECLRRLNINIKLGNRLLVIYKVDPLIELLENLVKNNTDAINASNYYSDDEDEELSGAVGGENSNKAEKLKTSNTQTNPSKIPKNNSNMANAMTIPDFMRLAAQTINKTFDGEPLELESFIDSINLLELVTTDALKPTLVRFVISKLKARAREVIPVNTDNIETIKRVLRENIKPDSSKVIAGRMMALKLDKKQIQDFSKQAEELSESFRRSLVVEGISQPKANEMAIDKTIEMCRASAKSDLVKSVLASSTFTDTKEVIAKLITETATDTSEKQVLAYQKFNNKNNNKQNYSRNNNNSRRGYYNNNYNNNNRNNNNSGRRGRGGGRGRYNYRNNTNRNYNNNNGYNNNNNYQNNGNNSVRYTENVQQRVPLGFQNQSNRNIQNN